MSSLLHPTGSEPPQVYWRRRITVLAVALLVVVGVIVVWPKGSPAPAPNAAPSVAASPSVTASAAVTVSSSPAASASPTPTGPQPCATENLRLSMAGYQKLAQGAKQPFTVAIKNAGTAPCVLTVNSTAFVLTVTSGSDRIWSTADCAAWVPTKKLTVKPQASYQFQINWPLLRSTPTCKTSKTVVNPGTYVGQAAFSDTLNARVVMLITKKA